MGQDSKIEWTEHTFNPWIGCARVSAGCANCYAEALNERHRWSEWGQGSARYRTGAANWRSPLTWAKDAREKGVRAKVFCASLADILDPEVPEEWFHEVLRLVAATDDALDWLFLTKREEQLARIPHAIRTVLGMDAGFLENLWVGVSAEDQAAWDRRVPRLAAIPAVVRFVSCEPLLGPIAVRGAVGELPSWIIAGGESGPRARPMEPAWAEELQSQCEERGIAFFFKQWGGIHKQRAGRELGGRIYNAFPQPSRRGLGLQAGGEECC